jgi:hypothetical protein
MKILLAVLLNTVHFLGVRSSTPDATLCTACVMVVGLVEEAGLQNRLANALKGKCNTEISGEHSRIERSACELGVDVLINRLEKHGVPEDLCYSVKACTTQGCQLFDKWPVDPLPPAPESWPTERRLREHLIDRELFPVTRAWAALQHDLDELVVSYGASAPTARIAGALMQLLAPPHESDGPCGKNITCHATAVANHLPFYDKDGDRFAAPDKKTLRGSHWRGYDCSEERADIYPGRKMQASGDSAAVDHNCNGISGEEPESGKTYEELWCADSQPRGLVILGDSATAHFHVPPQWLTANGWNLDSFLPNAEDELDRPMCSWGTGHVTPEECPKQRAIKGLTDQGVVSLYGKLRQRNRCNHNDFQNIGVNGARMTSSMGLVDALARNQKNDNPLLLFLSLLGNDVCNGHPGFDHMTTPSSYHDHLIETLTALDAQLPAGSHVVAPALFDGDLLYRTMHKQQHPIGTSYTSLYDFMNCLEENPCWGWLNSNSTVRLDTNQRAKDLSAVLEQVEATENNFKNFKFIFFQPDWAGWFREYELAGGNPVDIIEPVDGFHPSQTGNALFARNFWLFLENNHPEALGPVNPHNAAIDAKFFPESQ